MWKALSWPGESRLYYAACVILIIAAAGLRFYNLPSRSLTHDETTAANNANGTLSQVVENTREYNSSPILWPLGLWAIQKIESSPLSVRIVPAIASTLAVAALVFLLPRAGVERSTALLAGVLLAVSTTAIHAAQHVREYSLDALLVVVMLTGALWYLKEEKKWILLISLFVAPLLQYGLALFGAALILMIVIKRWTDSRNNGTGRIFPYSLRNFSFFIAPPMLSLALGSIITWFITLRYHGTGHGRDSYLENYYYRGELTDIPAVLRFVLQGWENILEFHFETIPVIMVISVIFTAFILRNSFRTNGMMILFLAVIAVASISVILGLYPLIQQRTGTGHERHILLWGPVVVLTFTQSIMVIANIVIEKMSKIRKINLRHPVAYRSAFLAIFIATVTVGGIWNISKYQTLYRDPDGTRSILEFLEQNMEDDDIIIWVPFPRSIITFYRGDMYRKNMKESIAMVENGNPEYDSWDKERYLEVLKNLPDTTKRIWIVHQDDLHGYEILAHLYDPDMVTIEWTAPSIELLSLSLVADARQAVRYFRDFEENRQEILEDPGDIVLRTDQYEVYLGKRTILYAASENCETIPHTSHIVLQIFPMDQNDLPLSFRKIGYENLDFTFSNIYVAFGEKCFAVRFLPDYPIDRIWTGAAGGELRFIYPGASLRPVDIDEEFIENLPAPVLKHDPWSIYSVGRHLVYVGDCDSGQTIPPFFVHLYPVEVADLPVERQEHGFANRDFYFSHDGGVVGDACVAVRELADYPIDYIHVGQYDETGQIWEATIEWEAGGPPPE